MGHDAQALPGHFLCKIWPGIRLEVRGLKNSLVSGLINSLVSGLINDAPLSGHWPKRLRAGHSGCGRPTRTAETLTDRPRAKEAPGRAGLSPTAGAPRRWEKPESPRAAVGYRRAVADRPRAQRLRTAHRAGAGPVAGPTRTAETLTGRPLTTEAGG